MFNRKGKLLLVASVLGVNALTILQIDGTFVFYEFGQIFLELFIAAITVYFIVKKIRNKDGFSLLKRLQTLFLGLLFILTIPLIFYLVDTDGGKRTIVQANAGGDLTDVQLYLREDGTFKLSNSGPFGGFNYRGKYKLSRDTLRLDNGDTILYPTRAFVIEQDTVKKIRYFDPIRKNGDRTTFYRLYIHARSVIP